MCKLRLLIARKSNECQRSDLGCAMQRTLNQFVSRDHSEQDHADQEACRPI
jgi:hypothetical protein